MRTGFPHKMQAGGYNLGVVEHHKGIIRQQSGQIPENILPDHSILIMKQLGGIPFGEGVFRYSGVLQAIIIVFYMNFRNHENSIFAAKLHNLSEIPQCEQKSSFSTRWNLQN